MTLLPCPVQKPGSRSKRIRHRFLGRKGFGSNEKKSRFRGNPFQDFRNMGAIYIGHKMYRDARLPIRPKRFGHHYSAKIGATNANIDDVGDAFTGITHPVSIEQVGRKLLHFIQHRIHSRHYVFPVYKNRGIGTVAQGGMQHRAIFCFVDDVSGKQSLNAF